MARSEKTLEETRRSKPVSTDKVAEVYETLKGVKVVLERDPDPQSLRAQYSFIRVHRNKVTKVLITLKARIAGLRADLIRVERVIEHDSSFMLATGEGLLGMKNETARRGRIKLDLEEWYDARAELRADVQMIDEAVSTVMIVREELRYAYDEASRSQASIELEYKIENSE